MEVKNAAKNKNGKQKKSSENVYETKKNCRENV